jgi:hypothetical protein
MSASAGPSNRRMVESASATLSTTSAVTLGRGPLSASLRDGRDERLGRDGSARGS